MAALLAVLVPTAPLAAQPAEPLTWGDALFNVGLRNETTLSTGEDLDFQSFEVELDLGVEMPLGPGRLKVLGRAWRDLRYDFDPTFEEATGGEGRSRVDLRELTWSVARGSTDWVLGRKLVTWGRADGLRLLDVVNPLDLREFLFEDFSRSKIPLWMVERRQYFGDWDWQVLLIPEYEPNRIAPRGTPFYDEVNDPARAAGVPGEAPRDFHLDDLEVATQLAGRVGRADVSFNYLYGHDDNPTIELIPRLTPRGAVVEPRKAYDRLHHLGGSFAAPVGDWLLRGEAVWIEGRRFPLAAGSVPPALLADPASRGLEETGQVQGLVGLDRNLNWTNLSFQHYQDRLADGGPALGRERRLDVSTAFLSREWRNGTLRGELLTFYVWEDGVWAHQPSLSYQADELLTLTVGATWTDGPRDSFFGQFEAANRLIFIAEYDL